MSHNILGLIVARGGSKSVPYKNIAPLGGKPLIQWCFEAAQQAKSITRIVCSTEDEKISNVCNSLGLEVCPRPKELAQDNSPPLPAVLDTLAQLERKGYCPDSVFLIQPTSPLVRPENFDQAAQLLEDNPHYAGVQSIRPVPHGDHAYNQRIFVDGVVSFAFHELRLKHYNKQLKPAFYAWGNIFLARTAEIIRQKTLFVDPTGGFIVGKQESLDIDCVDDFLEAEQLLRASGRL